MSKNYDDLDDLLDEFDDHSSQEKEVKSKHTEYLNTDTQQAPGSDSDNLLNTANTGAVPPDFGEGLPDLDEQFAEKLNLGVDDLVGAMESDPAAREMLASLVASLTGNDAQASGQSNTGKSSKAPASVLPQTFEDTISQTMGRLNETKSDSEVDNEDFLQKMLSELSSAAGTGADNPESDINGLIDGLMEELSSKEVLYEPLKDLHDRFPAWLESNLPKLEASEAERFQAQQTAVKAMVAKFEEASYSDSDAKCRQFITARMEDLQAAGAPPAELVGSLPGGAIPGAPALDNENCVIM